MNRAHQGLTAKEFLMYTDSRPPKIEESDEDNQENSDDTVQEDTNSDQSDNTSDNISQSPFDPPTAPTDLPEGFWRKISLVSYKHLNSISNKYFSIAIQWASETFHFRIPKIQTFFDSQAGQNGVYVFDFSCV